MLFSILRAALIVAMLVVAGVMAAPVAAQSVITLDDFDLGEEAASPGRTATGSIALCLRDPGKCPDRAGVEISIDDVVNLGIVDREEVGEIPASSDGTTPDRSDPLPSVDLEVLFDYNSSDVRADQMGQLLDLADVLRGDDFERYRLVFLGHTDAQGSAAYNEHLSRQRARSVAEFVATAANVPNDRIEAVGLGFQRLADPGDPFSEKNRRVQLVLVPGS